MSHDPEEMSLHHEPRAPFWWLDGGQIVGEPNTYSVYVSALLGGSASAYFDNSGAIIFSAIWIPVIGMDVIINEGVVQ